jgi:hypothetical protein
MANAGVKRLGVGLTVKARLEGLERFITSLIVMKIILGSCCDGVKNYCKQL